MKKILVIASLFISYFSVAQVPTGLPQKFYYKWYQYPQYVSVDSGLATSNRDTNWTPNRAGWTTYYNNILYHWNGSRWTVNINVLDTTWQNIINFNYGTYTNGLNRSGSVIKLGGTLSDTTYLLTQKPLYISSTDFLNIAGFTNTGFTSSTRNSTNIAIRSQRSDIGEISTYRPLATHQAGSGYATSVSHVSYSGSVIGAYYPFTNDTATAPLPAIADSTAYVDVAKGVTRIKGKSVYLMDKPSTGTTSDSVLVRSPTGEVKTVVPSNFVFTASNGLTKVVNDVKLGGTLTANTTISGAYNLTFSSPKIILDNSYALSDTAFKIKLADGTSGLKFYIEENIEEPVFQISNKGSTVDVYGNDDKTTTLWGGEVRTHRYVLQNASNGGRLAFFDIGDFWKEGYSESNIIKIPQIQGVMVVVPEGDSTGLSTDSLIAIRNNRFYKIAQSSLAYAASNGLTLSGSDFKLGGTLTANTTINTTGSYSLNVTGTNNSVLVAAASGAGVGVTGSSAADGGTGVIGVSMTGSSSIGVSGSVGQGIALKGLANDGGTAGFFQVTASSTNTTIPLIELYRGSSGTAANNIGLSIPMSIQTTDGSYYTSSRIISKFTDATTATRTSAFEIWGVNSAVSTQLLVLTGAGLMQLAQGAPEYADNAAAISGGLGVGVFYRTGDTVKIVH